jgi:glycosyltransferase involved in cell wall biosynthesis
VRVLHVVAPALAGGLERVVTSLAAGLRERGHEVRVAAIVEPGTAPHPFGQAAADAGVPCTAVVVPARAYLAERRAIARILRDTGPAVVHTHGYRPDVVDAPIARRAGIPTVTTVHGFTGGGRRNRLYEWLQERAFRRFDAVVAVSRPLADLLSARGVPGARLRTIVNAWLPSGAPLARLEARARLGVDPDRPRIGWVGRLSAEKGADLFVEALAQLDDRTVAASVVGTGPLLAALERRAARLGLADRLSFHGIVPDAGRLMAAFDVFVLSSRTEGTPIVLFEAVAAGVPVVATAVGGVPDVVTDTEAALVPAGEARALAAAIARTLAEPAAAAARAAAATRRLRTRYASGPWFEAYETLYTDLQAAGAR